MPRRRWVKLWTQETLYGTTIKELTPAQRWVWVALLCLAGDSVVPGTIGIATHDSLLPYTYEQLGKIVGVSDKTVKSSVEKCLSSSVNKLELTKNGCLRVVNWNRYQTDWQRIAQYESQQPTPKPTRKPTTSPTAQTTPLARADQTRPDQKKTRPEEEIVNPVPEEGGSGGKDEPSSRARASPSPTDTSSPRITKRKLTTACKRLGCALTPETDSLWKQAKGEIRVQMTKGIFDTWVEGTHLAKSETGLVLLVPTVYAEDILESRFAGLIQETLCKVAGEELEVAFASVKPREPP